MAGSDAASKLFDALNDSYDAFIDGVRAANDRGHRISTALIEQAQEGQRETVRLARKWAEAPLDFLNFYSSLVEASTEAQGRALETTRQWFGEFDETQKETREVLQRMTNANRAAGEAVTEIARGVFTRASEAVQSVGRSVSEGNGRRAARERARAAEASEAEATTES